MTSSKEQLVPVEQMPTPEMIAAAWTVVDAQKAAGGLRRLGPGLGVVEIWNAMEGARITALRTPPAQHPGWTERGKQWLADGAPIARPVEVAAGEVTQAVIKEICAAVVLAACESDPSDPEHPDTLTITTEDLDTIVRSSVEAALERLAALRTPPAVEPDEGLGLPGCPFCGATPHRGLGKKESCQMHGEPFQRYSIWCPKGHANVTAQNEAMARQEWSSRAGAPSIRAQALEAQKELQSAVEMLLWHYGRGDKLADILEVWASLRAALSALKGGKGV